MRKLILITLCLISAPQAALGVERIYEVLYEAEIRPDEGKARMSLSLEQPRDLVRELRFRIDPQRHGGFEGDGQIEREGRYVRWTPPGSGGRIRWEVGLTSRRGGAYDGMIAPDWAVFRGDDLVPPVYTRSLKGSRAVARLRFELPHGWSSITPYRKANSGDYPGDYPDEYLVVDADRNFDRPTGWMALGDIGVRWGTIADRRVAVAGPVGHGLRRLDILAFLRWTLPTVLDIFPDFGDRLLVVGAGDPMWRGGLSGPASLYIHADRPLISENGTSTLLHELVHVATSMRGAPGADWIVEGLSEYYALEILVRSGTTSRRRHRSSLEGITDWADTAQDLFVDSAGAEVTARAVLVMQAVDEQIRKGSNGRHSLDDLARALVGDGEVSHERFRALAEELAGGPVKALKPSRLPGKPKN